MSGISAVSEGLEVKMAKIISLEFKSNTSIQQKKEQIKKNVNIGDLVVLHFKGKEEISEHYHKECEWTACGYFHGLYKGSALALADSIGDNPGYIERTDYLIDNLVSLQNLNNINQHPLTDKGKEKLRENFKNPDHYLHAEFI